LRPASTSSSAPTPDEFRCAAFRGKHPAQKKQIARLRWFRIDAERLRRRREMTVPENVARTVRSWRFVVLFCPTSSSYRYRRPEGLARSASGCTAPAGGACELQARRLETPACL